MKKNRFFETKNSNKKKRRNKNRFWLIYGGVCALAITALTVFLFVFYDIIYCYENSQPQSVADAYAESIDINTVKTLAESAVSQLGLVYEKAETYTDVFIKAFDKDTLVCRKYLKEATAEHPMFSLLCGDVEIMRLTLSKNGEGSYGMTNWEITAAEIPIDGILEKGQNYMVYVPHGSTLSVNGFSPSPIETDVSSPLINSLEEFLIPSCDVYSLGTLYSTPEFILDYEGGKCSVLYREDGVHFFDSSLAPKNFTVNVPCGAEVYVNGIPLNESYVVSDNQKYDYSPIEAIKDGLPLFTSYSTGELFTSPEISATLNGITLEAEVKDNSCTFKYPAESTYSLTIRVPEGAIVNVDGIQIDTFCEVNKESAFGGLISVSAQAPMYDVYVIEGLYTSDFTVSASLNGSSLELKNESDANKLVYSGDNSATIDPKVSEFAFDFIKTYFHYTSSGYRNVSENLNAALAYIESGSDLYKKIKDSKIGYEFVTPVTSEVYNVLEVSNMYSLDDGSYVVKLNFDVQQTIVYVKRNYWGEIALHITGEDLKVRDMVITSESSEE